MTTLNEAPRSRRPTGSALVGALLRPDAYTPPVEDVGFLETHVSWLFFAGERVYKVKKPVDLGFIDASSLARRRHLCEEEVRLNQRLAPGVYRRVVPITRTGCWSLRVGGQGVVVEWAVEMKRLPADRMLSRLLERGEIDNQMVCDLVSLLVRFHAEAATGPGVDEFGAPAAVAALVAENLAQTRDAGAGVLSLEQLAFLERRSREFAEAHEDLLTARHARGAVREGHGDLHADNICYTDEGPVVYDRIEFSRRFRCGDVAADLAFLAMDLDVRGYPAFARYLVRRYCDLAGDAELMTLLDYYKAYRAVVRAKVAALTAGCGDPEQVGLAKRYLQLACGYALPPTLVLTCGLPGTGKSTLARALERPLRAVVLRTDVRRKVEAAGRLDARELYSPAGKERTYRSVLRDAARHLLRGRSVVVDATFGEQRARASFLDVAARLGLPWFVVHLTAEEDVVRRRMEDRGRRARSASDADFEVFRRQRRTFEPPTEIAPGHLIELSTASGDPEELSSLVLDRMVTTP